MQVHSETLSTIVRYLEREEKKPLEGYEKKFHKIVRRVSRFVPMAPGTRILEVGIGTGWFLVFCAKQGIACVGLDISPQLIEYVQKISIDHQITLDLRLGNIEDRDFEPDSFDVVLADSVFEHVEKWQLGLANVARCLRPGGVLFFTSTNRFCPRSGEFKLPFYGWLPNRTRYWIRKVVEGPDVMKLGIDFHQFTYWKLRRALKEAGFSQVYDPVDFLDPERLNHAVWWKVALLRTMNLSALARHVVLALWPSTEIIAVK